MTQAPDGPARPETGQVKRLSPQNTSADAAAFGDLFAPVLDSAGMVVFDWDMAHDSAVFAGSAERIFGSPLPEGGGSLFFDRIAVEDRMRLNQAIAATAALPAAGGPAGAWGPGSLWRVQGFDGKLRAVRSANLVFSDALGRPIRLRGFIQDQTEQQAALDALRDAERFRERFAMASPHQLYVVDLGTRRPIYANRSSWLSLGFGAEEAAQLEAEGRSVFERLHPDDRARFNEQWARWGHVADGEVVYTEIRLQGLDGGWRHYRHANTVFERGPHGEPAQLLGVAEDITEQREMEQQLLQAQKMESVGLLAGGVAHDFNNLLTVMQGYAREARALAHGEGALESLLSRLELAAARGASLTGQLLAFARRQPLDRRGVELNAWLKDSSPLIRRALGESMTVDLRLAPAPLWVQADPIQLDQVLLNLSLNARDAMGARGHLSLELEGLDLSPPQAAAWGMAPGPSAALRVVDSGPGMAPSVLARALEPFFTTKAEGRGAGLGLSTCFGIAKQHNGHLSLQSQLGQGTAVSMILPVCASDEAPASAALPPSSPRPAAAPTILLTEDLDDLRELLQRLLKHAGYRVLAARDGEEALAMALAEAQPIDALVTDLGLPKINGKDLTLQLRQRWPELKVLATSGHPPSHEGPASWLGQHGRFMAKPFNFDALLAELRALMGA
jgi:PAS domain S-box-containing protein